MAQLIQMRQRIKAIETIKKITHAMRLISMSTHSRVKTRGRHATKHSDGILELFHALRAEHPTLEHSLFATEQKQPQRVLLILVGSQKGLCGTFNAQIFQAFEQYQAEQTAPIDVIAVGKRAVDFIKRTAHDNVSLAAEYQTFSASTLAYVTEKLTHEVLKRAPRYHAIVMLNARPRTFFLQEQFKTNLKPLHIEAPVSATRATQEYLPAHAPTALLEALVHRTVSSVIRCRLLDSLLAEQAARFVAMDSSTRNATALLEEMQLRYNKIRQAKITKELIELSSSFSASF